MRKLEKEKGKRLMKCSVSLEVWKLMKRSEKRERGGRGEDAQTSDGHRESRQIALQNNLTGCIFSENSRSHVNLVGRTNIVKRAENIG